jgi:hypothetical protein
MYMMKGSGSTSQLPKASGFLFTVKPAQPFNPMVRNNSRGRAFYQ